MRIFLRDDVFELADAGLFQFFANVVEGRHTIEVEEAGSGYRRWLSQRSLDDQAYINLALAASYTSSALSLSPIAIEVSGVVGSSLWSARPALLTIDDASSLARLPYRILVENNISDRSFWLSIMTPEQRNVLITWEKSRAVEFVQGGGIEQVLARLEDDQVKDPGRLLTTFVLVDSDALCRGSTGNKAKMVRDFCRTNAIPCHVLRRRSAENYITMKALHGHAYAPSGKKKKSQEPIYQAFLNLKPAQRHYYHMKKGFSKTFQKGLFKGFDTTDKNHPLYGGWNQDGVNIGYLFEDESVKEHDLRCEGALRELGPVVQSLLAHIR